MGGNGGNETEIKQTLGVSEEEKEDERHWPWDPYGSVRVGTVDTGSI